MSAVRYDVVVPTVGRPELRTLLCALAVQRGPLPDCVIVVDDRRGDPPAQLSTGPAARALGSRLCIQRGAGRGPAAARNLGWRCGAAPWVAFLDDDVVLPPEWSERLQEDLRDLHLGVAASQGRIRVPLPADRRPTDRERGVAGLESAVWATADMAYRRSALIEVGGFDERFERAYREDSDLGLRIVGAGYRIVEGSRVVVHPAGAAGPLASVSAQAGNADDLLMRALHGRRWRNHAKAPAGRRRRHLAIAGAGAVGSAGALLRRPRVAATGCTGWLLGTVELAWARISPGPRTPREVALMVSTSVLIPIAAAAHTVGGVVRLRRRLADRRRAPMPAPHAVLLDRDGTLVVDVPYNGDPAAVRPMRGASEALDRLREAGIRTAVVSNQSGIGRGLLTEDRVAAVNRRVEELLGPLGPWVLCPHAPEDGCSCRKPAPGLVLRAAELLGTEPGDCAVIGDIGSDIDAARAAGARAILVPTPLTRSEEIRAAPEVAPDLPSAIDLLLGERAA